ncbi:hypothetical protein COLO4_30526 [Corchorus olitorius]|uniref:Uncharacterized protein n=1 Tax=Corchorus olitorius TaxID=93759 RepID=A0A1R3H895_9ROSI|nr:hypothetical protein COLO4_30526 [Corchorus olitorius]
MKSSKNKVSFATRPSKGSDENDRSIQEMGLNLGNPKKETGKNFMCPTVSADSKDSFQRRKILAERNESSGSNFSHTHPSKSLNFDSKPSPKTTSKPSHKNISPKKTPKSYNSRDETPSPGPYDPLINYLSPRPQFLRYDPGRRKQIFMRLQMNAKDADDETDSCCGEDGSSSCGCEEISEESGSFLEQEDDEIDIESDDEESEEEVGWNIMRNGLKFLLWSVILLLWTAYICSMNSPTHPQDFGFIQNSSNVTAEGVVAGFKLLDGKPKGQCLLVLKNSAVSDKSIEEVMAESITKKETFTLELEDRHHVESPEMVEEVKTDEDVSEEVLVKIADIYDHFSEEKATVKETEVVEVNGESEDIIEESLAEKEAWKELQNEVPHEDMVQGTIVQHEGISDTSVSLNIEEVNLINGPFQHSGTGILLKVLFGVITTIVASLVLRWRKAIASKHSSLVVKHFTKPVLNEKSSLVLAAEKEDHHALMNTVPLDDSADKDIEESYQRRAPSVELLSELEVEAISSSGKNCGLTTASNEVNNHSYFLEKDLKSKAYAAPVQDKKSFSEFSTPVNSNSSQKLIAKKKLSRKEFGNNNMAGLDGEDRNEVQTPSTLRRSDRLRNRSVTSPPKQ